MKHIPIKNRWEDDTIGIKIISKEENKPKEKNEQTSDKQTNK